MINCCHLCRHRNACYKNMGGFPDCIQGIDCSNRIVTIGRAKTHEGCLICPRFRPSRRACSGYHKNRDIK